MKKRKYTRKTVALLPLEIQGPIGRIESLCRSMRKKPTAETMTKLQAEASFANSILFYARERGLELVTQGGAK